MTNTFFTSSARWERSDLHLNICIFFSAHLSNLLASFCQRAVQLTCYIFQWTNVQHMNSYVHNPYIFVQQIINFISKQGWAAVGASAAHFALVTTKYQLKCLEREVYIPHCRFRVQPTTVYFSTASGLIHKMSKVLERRVSMDSKMSTCLVKGQNGDSKSTGGWLMIGPIDVLYIYQLSKFFVYPWCWASDFIPSFEIIREHSRVHFTPTVNFSIF